MSSLASTPGKYKDWNEPLEAMLRATESTLHRLKVNHERYKKSKNKLEAALNAPTYYTFTTPAKNNSNSNSNMCNQMNVLPRTTDRTNSLGKVDYRSSKNNNNEIKNCQSRHSKDYILTETNERDNSYSLHRSSVVKNNISISASRATSLSASYPWEPQPRKDDIEHSIDDNKPIKGDTMTALSSTMYTPTPVSMSMIRIFQSQLKNLMHEIWKERSEREDSMRNYKEKCENDVEELQLTLRHIARDVDRIREEHIMEKEQQQQQRESHYNWRNNENDKTKIENLETQVVQLTEQVQLLVEKSNDMHVVVKKMKSEEEEELVPRITNVINEKVETELQNISSESTFMSKLRQSIKQEIECYKENSVKPNEEYIVHMIHDAIAEKCNDGLHKTLVSILDAREETLCNEMNAQMNTAKMQQKEELTMVQQQMLNFSKELENLKEKLADNSLEVNERKKYLHREQKEECNAHAVNAEECKVIIAKMLEPLVLQLTELRNKQQKQELLESECKSDKKDSIDTKSENWVLKFQILQNELHDLKQHVQDNYYTREEVQTCIERLQDKLDEVKQTIDANNNVSINDVIKNSTEYLEKFTHDAMEKFCTERLKVLLEQEKQTQKEHEEEQLLLLEKAHAKLQNETRNSMNALRSEINEAMSERLEEQYANIKTEMALLHGTVNNEIEEYCSKQSRELTGDIRQEIRNTEQKIGSRHNALKDQVNSLEQQLMETQHELECNREEHKRTSDTHDVYISDLQNDCRTLHDQLEHLSSENALAVSQQRVSRELEQEVMNYVDKQVEMLDSSHEVEVSELINTLSTVHDSIAQCVSRASQTLEAQS